MEFLSTEMLEKFISPKDLVSIGVIWLIVRGRVASHFTSIETSLQKIVESIESLKKSIVSLEKTQSDKISELNHRVTKLELK